MSVPDSLVCTECHLMLGLNRIGTRLGEHFCIDCVARIRAEEQGR